MQCARPFVHKYTNGCFLVAWAVCCGSWRRQNRPRLTWWCLGRCPPRGVAEEAALVRSALCALRTLWATPYLSIQTNDSNHYGIFIGSKTPQGLEPLAQQRAAGAVGGVHSFAAVWHRAVGVPPVPAPNPSPPLPPLPPFPPIPPLPPVRVTFPLAFESRMVLAVLFHPAKPPP